VKVALIHDWLTGMRGGEKVLESLCELFPTADLFTLLHTPGSVSPTIESHQIKTSFIQKLPFSGRQYRYYLPLMPAAIQALDVTEYDLIVSSSYCAAKGIRKRPGAVHLCYCHTPMRYIWDQYDCYFGAGQAAWPVRLLMGLLRKPLQRWDIRSSQGVDYFIANSRHVAARIRRIYGRESRVIYPPVDVERFQNGPAETGDYFLTAGALVPYKRTELAVDACTRLKLPLRVIGIGPDLARLKRRAGPTVEFLGWQTDESLKRYLRGCRALLFPGEEDFGIVPVEAQAAGRPVIAYGKGGVTETLEDGVTGTYFHKQTANSLIQAIARFETLSFEPKQLRESALRFEKGRFSREMRDFLAYAGIRP